MGVLGELPDGRPSTKELPKHIKAGHAVIKHTILGCPGFGKSLLEDTSKLRTGLLRKLPQPECPWRFGGFRRWGLRVQGVLSPHPQLTLALIILIILRLIILIIFILLILLIIFILLMILMTSGA